jgi:hypothetical protein
MEKVPLLSGDASVDNNIANDSESIYFIYSPEIEVDQELICSICQQVFQDPSRSVNCGHTFCQHCIQKWSQCKATCPLDNIPLGQMQFDRLAFNLIENFSTECTVCNQWKGTKSQLRIHLKEQHSIELFQPSHTNSSYTLNLSNAAPPPTNIPRSVNTNAMPNMVRVPPNVQYPPHIQPQIQIPGQPQVQITVFCYFHRDRPGVTNCVTCRKVLCRQCQTNPRFPQCITCQEAHRCRSITFSVSLCVVVTIIVVFFCLGFYVIDTN